MYSDTQLTISVIIPVYKGGQDFQQCLNALATSSISPDEIIIVADGGMNGPPRPHKSLAARIIETPLPGGPARARNLGAQQATGDILFFFDADVAIQPDTIQKVKEIFSTTPQLSALFGSYDDAPGKSNFLSQYRNLLHHYVHQTGNKNASTFWSGCGAIRRDVFLKFNGFNETLFDKPAIEDIELGYRLKKAGYQIQLCKDIQVKHLKRWSAVSIVKTDFFQRALPWTALILRDRNFLNDLNTDSASRASVILTFLLPVALLAAFWQPVLFMLFAVMSCFLIFLNRQLYQFFREKRGSWFTIKVLPWHWFYYVYSGLAFAIGIVDFFLGTLRGHPRIRYPLRNI